MKVKTLDKNSINVAAIMLTFMATVGDADRTALAFNLEVSQVEELAESEGWREQIRRVSIMSKGGRPGDFERATNRAMCFVQAQLLRQQIDRLLKECQDMTSQELLERACVRTRDGGTQLSAKFLTDMASAAEACHRMAYAALGDTVSERTDSGSGSAGSSNDMHASVIAFFSNPGATSVPTSTLLLQETNDKLAELSQSSES